MKAIDKIRAIQDILQVAPDGHWGPKSKGALDTLIASPLDDEWPMVVKSPLPDASVPNDVVGDKVDARSEGNIATLHPQVRPLARALIQKAAQRGIKAVITSGTRTYAEQNDLYEQGRSKPGKVVTNARGGQSNHNFGIAFDITLFDGASPVWESPKYKTVGQIGKSLGLNWGGDWASIKDEPHFELHPEWAKDLSESAMLSKLRERHSNGVDAFA